MRGGYAVLRAGQGLILLAAPEAAVRGLVSCPVTPGAQAVLRVLGTRQLAQALVYVAEPARSVRMLGSVTDLMHFASMLALACADRRWRRAALVDALVAAGYAYVGFSRVRNGRGARRRLPLPH